MICGLAKIRSVDTYVIPWIHWFEPNCIKLKWEILHVFKLSVLKHSIIHGMHSKDIRIASLTYFLKFSNFWTRRFHSGSVCACAKLKLLLILYWTFLFAGSWILGSGWALSWTVLCPKVLSTTRASHLGSPSQERRRVRNFPIWTTWTTSENTLGPLWKASYIDWSKGKIIMAYIRILP